jgi:hypothetical protein
MSTTIIRIKIILLLFFPTLKSAYAQDIERQQIIDNSAIEYMRIAGNQSALFYGIEQIGHPRLSNHPYLIDEQYAQARLSFNGIIYPEVMLRLDLNRGELIIQSSDFRNIVLSPENVDFAELHGRHIIYFRHDNLPGSPPTGYYFLLHSGETRVLKRQTAVLRIDQHRREQNFIFLSQIFLYKDGAYHTIRNRRELLRILYPHRRELRQYISANRLRFRHNAEGFITQVVREYEKLSGL